MRSLVDEVERHRAVARRRPAGHRTRIGRQMLRPLFVIVVLTAAAVMGLGGEPSEFIPIRTASSPLAATVLDYRAGDVPAQQPGPTVPKPGPDGGCQGPGCIVAPSANTPAGSTAPGATPSGPAPAPAPSCSFFDWGACISGAIDSLSRQVVTDALNPMLDLLSGTLLTTPAPASIPRLVELWTGSWEVLLACYGLLVLIAGIVLMAYETVQTRYGLREIAPRLVLGLLTGALSLTMAGMAVDVANALSEAVLGEKIGESAGADALSQMIKSALTTDSGALLLLIMGVAVSGALLALLLTYVVRVAITLVLIAGAPIALMFHALPQTEGIARWWWRTLGACLAIQIVQSLTLITALHVLLTPGGGFGLWTEGEGNGFGTLLFVLALLYILCKIPSWLLSASKIGGGRSVLGSLARSFIAYKTFGLLGGGRGGKGGGKASASAGRRGRGPGGRGGGGSPTTPSGPSDPYAKTKATADGQLMLPLDGLVRRRAQRATTPPPPARPRGRPSGAGRQLALPLAEGDWPENRPKLGADGQYRLPLDLTRTPAAKDTSGPATPAPRTGPAGRQLALPLTAGDWPENQPKLGVDGQYQLPLDVRRTRPTTRPPAAPPTATNPATGAASATRGRAQQLELLFDPYARNRPLRGGQYPLPLEGVSRQPRPPAATPVTGRPPTAARRQAPTATPSPATGAPRARQLPLPIPPRAATTPTAAPPATPRTAAPPSSSSRRTAAPTGTARATPPTKERPRRPGRAAVPDRAAPVSPAERPQARRATRPTTPPPPEPAPTPPPGGQLTRPAPRRRARPSSGDDSS